MLFSVTHPPDIPFVCKRNSVRGLTLFTQVHSAYSVDKDYGRQKTTKKIRQEENYGKILILEKKKRKIQISEEMVVISFSEEQKRQLNIPGNGQNELRVVVFLEAFISQ